MKRWQTPWGWAIALSIGILFLSCLPYFGAGQLAPTGWQFGGLLVNPQDGYTYLAKMRQGADGSWLFHMTYTAEPHPGVFIFVFYLGLGHVAALTGLPLIWLFHLARLLAGFGLLMAAFRFIRRLTDQWQIAFILLVSSSGLGWLGAILGFFPIDLWVPEAFVPYSLYANPHFPLGMALMLVIAYEVAWPDRYPASLGWIGVAGLALALTLPFGLIMVEIVLAGYILWLYGLRRSLPRPQIWLTLTVGLVSAPVIFYDYWITQTQPIIVDWSAQNVTPAPALINVGLGYGLVGLFALVGGWLVLKEFWSNGDKEFPQLGLVLIWAVITPLLVYLPLLDLQRRFIIGWQIPLAILAAIGLERGLPGRSWRRPAIVGVVALGAMGTLFVWGMPLLGIWLEPPSESETTALFFVRNEEKAALSQLDQQAAPDAVILAPPRLGLFVPAYTGSRVFYGHPFETVEAEAKRKIVEAFYRGEADIPPPVDFVISDSGKQDQLADYPIIFSEDNLLIYQVK